MGALSKSIDQLVCKYANEHPDISSERIKTAFNEAVIKSLPQVTEIVFHGVLKNIPEILPLNKANICGFVERNIKFWDQGLDLLEVLSSISLETGEAAWQEWDHGNKKTIYKRKRPASPICYFVFLRVNYPSTITRRIFYGQTRNCLAPVAARAVGLLEQRSFFC